MSTETRKQKQKRIEKYLLDKGFSGLCEQYFAKILNLDIVKYNTLDTKFLNTKIIAINTNALLTSSFGRYFQLGFDRSHLFLHYDILMYPVKKLKKESEGLKVEQGENNFVIFANVEKGKLKYLKKEELGLELFIPKQSFRYYCLAIAFAGQEIPQGNAVDEKELSRHYPYPPKKYIPEEEIRTKDPNLCKKIKKKLENTKFNLENLIERFKTYAENNISEKAIRAKCPSLYEQFNRYKHMKETLRTDNPGLYEKIDLYEHLLETFSKKFNLREIVEHFKAYAEQKGIEIIDIKKRTKDISSIYRSLKRVQGRTPDNIRDINGIKILVPTPNDCYKLLYLVHEILDFFEWRLFLKVSDLFHFNVKDHILTPKPNGYQALIVTPVSNPTSIEIQIQTPKMEEYAEKGPASNYRLNGLPSK